MDMDEVLCNFVQRCVDIYNAENNTTIKASDVHSFKVTDVFHIGDEKKVDEYMRRHDFYEKMTPVEGAVEGMRQLLSSGHRVTIATSIAKSAPNLYEQKFYWIKKHLPFFDIDDLTGIHRKYKLNGDVLFDDGIHNLIDFHEKGNPTGIAIAMDKPWNREWTGLRVHSWKEFIDKITTISGWYV